MNLFIVIHQAKKPIDHLNQSHELHNHLVDLKSKLFRNHMILMENF